MKKLLILLLPVFLFTGSCKNDLEILDEYSETMAVYCLLNSADSVQYVKINKSFLGPLDAYGMAGVFDSINYGPNDLTVFLEKIVNGNVVQSIPLFLDSLLPKDSGVFAFPLQYLYKCATPIAGDGSEYKITVINNEPGFLPATASAKTILPIPVNSPILNQVINLYGTVPYKSKFQTSLNGKLFSMTIRFHYREVFTFDTSQVAFKYIDIPFNIHRAPNLSGGEIYTEIVEAEHFFKAIGNNPGLPDDNNLIRNFLQMEFIYYAAGSDFADYLDVVAASNSAFNEAPIYTNITNGIGLFSTRYRQVVKGVKLNTQTLDSLMYGQYTEDKNFR